MTTPDESPETRSPSTGPSRTPPPRPRRGAPAVRAPFDELDALDDLLAPEQKAALVEPGDDARTNEPPRRSNTATTTRRAATTRRGEPRTAAAEPAATAAIDWDAATRFGGSDAGPADRPATFGRDATFAPTEDFGDPVEPEIAFEPPPALRPAQQKAAKRPERRFRQTIQKVDLWSVTKIALCFYVSAMGVVLVSLIALWVVADSAGIIDNVENFIGDLFSSEDFHFVSGEVLRGAVLVGVVCVALMLAFTIIAASFYNIFAELFGGIEVVIREEEQPPKR